MRQGCGEGNRGCLRVDRCWKQGLPAQRGSRADHFSGQMLEEARGEEPGDERTSSGISLSTCVNYSLHCVDFLPSRPLRKWGRRSCARGCTRPVRHGCTVTRGGKLADAGRCLRQGFQGKLKNSPAQSGRNRLRCAPSRPPCRAPVRQADRRASARGGSLRMSRLLRRCCTLPARGLTLHRES